MQAAVMAPSNRESVTSQWGWVGERQGEHSPGACIVSGLVVGVDPPVGKLKRRPRAGRLSAGWRAKCKEEHQSRRPRSKSQSSRRHRNQQTRKVTTHNIWLMHLPNRVTSKQMHILTFQNGKLSDWLKLNTNTAHSQISTRVFKEA